MSTRRFHVDDLSPPIVSIGGTQAHHAIRVLRMKAGDSVVLFDGSGREALGTIESTRSDSFVVRIRRRERVDSPSESRLALAVAPPKGARGDWLVEKCAEIGVAVLQPLVCERSQVLPRTTKIERWRRKAIEAAKQARRAVPMRVEEPLPLNEVLTRAGGKAGILFGDPDPSCPILTELLISQKDNALEMAIILIGPEGGFSPVERDHIVHLDGQAVRLNTGILRVETAAVVAAAIWTAWCDARCTKCPISNA